jgi:3'(2'), 5'-bisphosphate nucleotidase
MTEVGTDGASLQKDDKSPVTIADFGSQAIVCHYIREAFPNDTIVAEEDSADLQTPEAAALLGQVTMHVNRCGLSAHDATICSWIDAGKKTLAPRFWTLDPIDGTKGFLRNDQYAIALALIEEGEVRVAALACPALPHDMEQPDGEVGILIIAVRGQGATMVPLQGGPEQNIRVGSPGSAGASRFVESVEAAHGDQSLQETIARAAGINRASLRMDSQAKYGAVARGDAALDLRLPSPKSPDYREKIWDHAAGALIIEEAGGTVTDMHGRPLDFANDYKMKNNRGVVVSNGSIHAAVIDALQTASR